MQRHHRIQRSLDRLLSTYAKQHGLDWEPSVTGQGVQVSGKGSYIPDLVVATTAQWEDLEAINESSIFRLGNPPLLVVEVVSPDSQKKDAEERLIGYATARVPEYWIVNPFIATVSVWILEAQVYTCKGKFKGDQQVKSELLKHLTMISAYLLGDM